ncbi:MAG TPA: LytTR family DNA-binding domain-containing protein [Draconibacterium sp.]|nr:LytTR family DNA-binding domain-containing protein [Draconibacterium sp.]
MKALIIEDESPAAKQLVNILKKLNDVVVVDILDSIKSTVEWFKSNAQPDVVFMDIHIADGSAFKIFDFIEITCPIIFSTAYDEYAINAFKVNSVDYLLKPITQEGVEKAFKKINQLTGLKSNQIEINQIIKELNRVRNYKTHFLVSVKGSKMIPLLSDEIAFFYILEGKVKAITFSKNDYLLDYTLDDLSTKLNPDIFFRANRQFIISKSAIKELDSWFNGRLSVVLKIPAPEKILISRTRVGEFKDWFTGQ